MFSDYAFYVSRGGKLPLSDYNAVVDDAHAEIMLQTNGRARTAPEEMLNALKICECKLVDVIASYKAGLALMPKGVSSISNDGYSISMRAENPVSAQMNECRALCQRYLREPVDLLSRWL